MPLKGWRLFLFASVGGTAGGSRTALEIKSDNIRS